MLQRKYGKSAWPQSNDMPESATGDNDPTEYRVTRAIQIASVSRLSLAALHRAAMPPRLLPPSSQPAGIYFQPEFQIV